MSGKWLNRGHSTKRWREWQPVHDKVTATSLPVPMIICPETQLVWGRGPSGWGLCLRLSWRAGLGLGECLWVWESQTVCSLTLFLCPSLGHFLIFISFQTVVHILRKDSELSNSRSFCDPTSARLWLWYPIRHFRTCLMWFPFDFGGRHTWSLPWFSSLFIGQQGIHGSWAQRILLLLGSS